MVRAQPPANIEDFIVKVSECFFIPSFNLAVEKMLQRCTRRHAHPCIGFSTITYADFTPECGSLAPGVANGIPAFHGPTWRLDAEELRNEESYVGGVGIGPRREPCRTSFQRLPQVCSAADPLTLKAVALQHSKLRFKQHIKQAAGRATSDIKELIPLLSSHSQINLQTRVALFISFITPLLTYASPIWVSTAAYYHRPIYRAYYRGFSFITAQPPLTHSIASISYMPPKPENLIPTNTTEEEDGKETEDETQEEEEEFPSPHQERAPDARAIQIAAQTIKISERRSPIRVR
ncbi:hypothetical protein PR048_014159 [Dryococelus australis]|uniref:Uncharacterized protein n=1 Tax=Dryococelus australis TaxID=614101 RepID=A0ABQ9HDG0_9NEOP|nr:hypothetical protein PR048_014159 [Dryococelus australis]